MCTSKCLYPELVTGNDKLLKEKKVNEVHVWYFLGWQGGGLCDCNH